MNNQDRLESIINIARNLNWIFPNHKGPYPLMSLSEVEKCMIAMVDDDEFNRMKEWIYQRRRNHD